jgi:hypothetical protein
MRTVNPNCCSLSYTKESTRFLRVVTISHPPVAPPVRHTPYMNHTEGDRVNKKIIRMTCLLIFRMTICLVQRSCHG